MNALDNGTCKGEFTWTLRYCSEFARRPNLHEVVHRQWKRTRAPAKGNITKMPQLIDGRGVQVQ